MQQPTSLVTFLLDRSGSMLPIKPATIEGFNAYLTGLQAEKDADIFFTFLQFDTQSLDKVCVAIPVGQASPLTPDTFIPRGGTPLIDAAVKTINAVAKALEARTDKPRVVVCFQTDGEENSSAEHTWEELRSLIAAKEAEGWQFNFLGAGIDAYVQAQQMGIAAVNAMSYDSAHIGTTREAFTASASNAAGFSAGRASGTGYTVGQRTSSGDRFTPPDVSVTVGVTQHVKTSAPAPLDLTTAAPSKSQRRRPSSVPDLTL